MEQWEHPFGGLEVTAFHYGDEGNETCVRAVQFCVPGEAWTAFQSSQLYQDIAAYVDELGTEYKDYWKREPEREAGNDDFLPSSTHRADGESASVPIRRALSARLRLLWSKACGKGCG